MSEPSTPTVRRNDAEQQYEIAVGGRPAGLSAYADRGDQRVFFHTEVDPAFSGQGLASVLIRQALEDTRAGGRRVVPVCSFVADFLSRHQEFADLADPVTAETVDWLRSALG